MISATTGPSIQMQEPQGSGIKYPSAASDLSKDSTCASQSKNLAKHKKTDQLSAYHLYLLSYTMEHLAECLECTNLDVEASYDTSLISHRERRISNLMFSRKPPHAAADPPLSPGDRETLGEIRSDLKLEAAGSALSDAEIVDLALQLLRRDLNRGLEAEVLEEVRRETDYRHWCASIDGVHEGVVPAGSLRRDGGSE